MSRHEDSGLDQLVAGELTNGIYVVVAGGLGDDPIARVSAAGRRVHVADLRDATDKAAALEAIGQAVAAPSWFGHNWDALFDLLIDLSWLAGDGDGHVVVLAEPGDLATTAPGDWATLLEVLRDVTGWWTQRGRPFHVLIRATDPLSGLTAIC